MRIWLRSKSEETGISCFFVTKKLVAMVAGGTTPLDNSGMVIKATANGPEKQIEPTTY